jgi:hypothetical protein
MHYKVTPYRFVTLDTGALFDSVRTQRLLSPYCGAEDGARGVCSPGLSHSNDGDVLTLTYLPR